MTSATDSQVTVILCSFNGADTLKTALESALTQTLPGTQFEVLLIDDGSTDNTSSIALSYDTRWENFRYIHLPTNKGLVNACNVGLAHANGKFVIRLDDDDTFDSTILETMVKPLEEDWTDLVYSDRCEIEVATGREEHICLSELNIFQMIAAGTMMRRSILNRIGGYRPVFWEEYDLYIRYAQECRRPFHRIPEVLYHYNRRPGSMTMTRSKADDRQGWQELKDLWGLDTLLRFGWDPDLLGS